MQVFAVDGPGGNTWQKSVLAKRFIVWSSPEILGIYWQPIAYTFIIIIIFDLFIYSWYLCLRKYTDLYELA